MCILAAQRMVGLGKEEEGEVIIRPQPAKE